MSVTDGLDVRVGAEDEVIKIRAWAGEGGADYQSLIV